MTNHIIAGQDTAIAITRTIRAAMTNRGFTFGALSREIDLPQPFAMPSKPNSAELVGGE